MGILHVDVALMSSYTSHLLKGSSLVMPYRSYTPTSLTHSRLTTAMLQISRTFSRVDQIWVLPSEPNANLALKDSSYFPSLGSANTLESWIQMRSTKFPATTYGARNGRAPHALPEGARLPLQRLPSVFEYGDVLQLRLVFDYFRC